MTVQEMFENLITIAQYPEQNLENVRILKKDSEILVTRTKDFGRIVWRTYIDVKVGGDSPLHLSLAMALAYQDNLLEKEEVLDELRNVREVVEDLREHGYPKNIRDDSKDKI